MEARIGGRLKAAPAHALPYLFSSRRENRDRSADAVAIGSGPLELKRDKVRTRPPGLVMKVNQRLVLRDHHGVQAPVVVEVADGQAPADIELLKRRACLGRDLGEMA